MKLTVSIPAPAVTSKDIPNNEATRFTNAMRAGWNLGNTMDAHEAVPVSVKEEDYETIWCGVKTTQPMIDFIKAAGFDVIRLPVTWHPHVDEAFNVSKVWLDRVQEVVDYAWKNDMTVILNIHHDDDERYVYPDSAHYERSSLYVKRIWGQLAERFKDYDEKLIFEGLNEPRLKGTEYEWRQDFSNPVCQDALETLCKLHQDFVDTVRASAGYNASRYLMVGGLAANADSAANALFRLPSDTVEHRLIVSIHAYTPHNFALLDPKDGESVSSFDMTSKQSTRDIDAFLDKSYETFIAKGIPVIIGEFGARDKGGNLRDRVEFAAYYTAAAKARGIPCVWWDNCIFSGGGECFAILNRTDIKWEYPDITAALTMER